MTKFIGISGKKGHGKNFFADLIVPLLIKDFNTNVAITAFATPIKEFCHNVFGLSYEDMETQEGKLKQTHLKWGDLFFDIRRDNRKDPNDYITVRELLQVIGTDVWRKRFYDKIWAEAPFHKKWDAGIVLITDCRFPNEIKVVKNYQGILVRVVRPGVISNDNHISEIALDNYDWQEDEIVINKKIHDLMHYYETTLKKKLCE